MKCIYCIGETVKIYHVPFQFMHYFDHQLKTYQLYNAAYNITNKN
jgi:hypothetical protein